MDRIGPEWLSAYGLVRLKDGDGLVGVKQRQHLPRQQSVLARRLSRPLQRELNLPLGAIVDHDHVGFSPHRRRRPDRKAANQTGDGEPGASGNHGSVTTNRGRETWCGFPMSSWQPRL